MQTRVESNNKAIAAIIAISLVASAFLFWLVYVHSAPQGFATRLLFLPALDALMNGLSAICLIVGFYFIRNRNIPAHRASMLTAFGFSSIFLVSYIINHALHGDSHFLGQGPIRTVYFSVLISHILLCILALPMVLITFFFSLTGRFPQHKKIARFTFPVWLYVSITGVVVYAMLHSGAGR